MSIVKTAIGGLGPRLRRWEALPAPVRRRLRIARQIARRRAGTSSLLYAAYQRIAEEPHRRDQWVGVDTDLVIEGFGGSGNTVLYEVATQLCSPDVTIAHHLHVANQVDRAVAFEVPAIITVRPPHDAITSLVRRGFIESPRVALQQYVDMHRAVLGALDSIVVVTFEEVVQDPFALLQAAMRSLGCSSLIVADPANEQIGNDSYAVDISDTGTDVYYPPSLRQTSKAEAAHLVSTAIGDDLQEANELYKQILLRRRNL